MGRSPRTSPHRGGTDAHGQVRLFRAFDELQDIKADGRRLVIDAAMMEEALASLGLELAGTGDRDWASRFACSFSAQTIMRRKEWVSV